MIDFINEFLPSVLAGLIPALVTFGTTVHLIIKNLRVDKNVNELQGLLINVKHGNLDIKEITQKAIPALQNLTEDMFSQFSEVTKEFIKEDNDTVNQIREENALQLKETKATYELQINKVRSEIQKFKLGGDNDDVSKVW